LGKEDKKKKEIRPKMKTVKIEDFLRGKSGKEITIRFDPNNVIELPCHCKYDPALSKPKGNQAIILRKVEVQNEDGSWSLYPSVTWLDGVEDEEQLMTRALVKITGEEAISIMGSSDGVPDGTLMSAANEAGVYTETIDG
jgi:hypothetical protein